MRLLETCNPFGDSDPAATHRVALRGFRACRRAAPVLMVSGRCSLAAVGELTKVSSLLQ